MPTAGDLGVAVVDVVERGHRRQRDSVPVLAEIESLLLANLHGVLPKSLLGQALHYLTSQWSKLKRYVEDGRYSIDNNVQENAIRPFCVGRRNWLFSDTVAGANASANLYSLLQTCQVIPIRGGSAKQRELLGFAGRALQGVPPDGVAKYLLTSGFEKAKVLFNEPAAFNAVKQTLKAHLPARLYLVEGFLDALRLQSLGLPAVALMGTSLGKESIERLKTLAEDSDSSAELEYSLFLDNDSAGFGGTDRLVRRLLDLRGVNLRWVGMPWRSTPALGKDPDTCLRGLRTAEQAIAWLQPFDLPAEAVLLAQALGAQDASDLQPERFSHLVPTVRERALFRVGMSLRRLYGPRPAEVAAARLKTCSWEWAQHLHAELAVSETSRHTLPARRLYLEESLPRVALAHSLAYHGARRGELPCDEEVWQTLGGNARLFDQIALDRLRAMMDGDRPWKQAAPFDAVHLPRKLTADPKVLDDPRRKVMPHPADLLVQQMVLDELLSQRHDRPSAAGRAFSDDIPAVRWYASRREVLVTGLSAPLNEFDVELDLPKTLSFGYQIDMDVLEGDQTPSDQGMFRPFGQCWREFMASLTKQCHAIGPRVHVLRLDAKRYYDSIQRFVVRDALLTPVNRAMAVHGVPEGFGRIFGLPEASAAPWDARLEAKLERLMVGLIFHHEYRDPDVEGKTQHSSELIGIPQGPVLSAYIGTIALFPVDEEARRFIHSTADKDPNDAWRPRAGYARYVDDIVLFADSEDLLKQLRELLQTKAAERSIDLIHKGDRVRAGSPQQVMRQLNDGRGLAPSVPAWDPPLVGDGETDYSLGGELPEVDRQCALQMLRRVALMHEPRAIAAQVKTALGAPDLRAGDLGLCARWLWWQVAASAGTVATPESLWERFWDLWNAVCGEYPWAGAFALRGYHWLFAVEGLDKLLDSHPWQENGKLLTEREEDRKLRLNLARKVCETAFIAQVKPATNSDHVLRRARLVVRKAHRLLGNSGATLALPPQQDGPLTAIEWLCIAGPSLAQQDTTHHPLNALRKRRPERSSNDGLVLANGVIDQLALPDDASSTALPNSNAADVGLAIDFVINSSPSTGRLATLAKRFPYLISQSGVSKQLIPHLPSVSETAPADAVGAQERVEEQEVIWPFDTLPAFSLQRCDEVMAALSKALPALDDLRGMQVVSVRGQKFGRQPHIDEFTDASGASWQVSTPQFTSLFSNTLTQRTVGQRKLTLWSETRRAADNELLAVHTLDHKLGQWFRFEDLVPAVREAAQMPHGGPGGASVQRDKRTEADKAPPAVALPAEVVIPSQRDQAAEHPVPSAPVAPAVSDAVRVDRLEEWQKNSWSKRFGVGRTTDDEDLAARGHLRVALFQWRVDDSYSHPIAEVGLSGLPLAPAAQKALHAHLDGDFKDVHKAAKRGAEFYWQDDRKVFSWPEHRRRVLLGQALRACRELKVQLLVLPEVSVRPDTVEWLKSELLHHPGLAVLAGTFRQFEAENSLAEHLKEKLTLLWQPAKAEAKAFGLQGDAQVMQFQRDKKYRAVAAHELFRPGNEELAPLYREGEVLKQLGGTSGRTWTIDQLQALMQALIHGPQKLRYCMELICSELFLLTSPANRRPLLQDLAKVLQQFGVNATAAADLVDGDILALGELLTVSQANRERRSVLLVPACTSRSNDYWHAGQASVLSSGTATVFCNAVSKGLSVGGSCFIGCDSVQRQPKEHPGIVRLLTPYHGWQHGILQPSCQGALSDADQALVVVDLDPVHLVSGKPRPQLLPEPVSMVAYLPIVEVLRQEDNAQALVAALRDQLKGEGGCQTLERMLTAEAFPTPCEALHTSKRFCDALDELLKAKRAGSLTAESGGPVLDTFAGFFNDPAAVRQRIMACLRDHHQQPAPMTKADGLDLEPAWLDFLVADLTWKQSDDGRARKEQPAIRVPPWRHVLPHPNAGESGARGGDPTAA